MARFDRKFLLPVSRLPALLEAVDGRYSALEIDGRRVFRYESLYYDTPGLDFFRMHHDGRLNRYKVRHRVYLDSGTRFLEVKFKDNRRKTEKSRIPAAHDEIESEGYAFLEESLAGGYSDLRPSQHCRFQRIALARFDVPERVTIDFNVSFQAPGTSARHHLPGLMIVELKQERRTLETPLYDAMRMFHTRPMSFSKYCVGCCLSRPQDVKGNRFKRVLDRARAIGQAS